MRPPPARPNIIQPAAGGLRRSTSNRVSNSAASTSTEQLKTDRSRPPLTQSRHLRNPSASSTLSSNTSSTRGIGHARTKSSSTLLSASTTLRPPGDGTSSSRSALGESQLKRPAFSTLQQHFSPAKTLGPKPHPAAFLAPPSPSKLPSNIAISAETAKLQTELLQLHLLHRDATQVQGDWSASAKWKLGARFKSVVSRNEALLQLEVDETSKTNALALKKWQDEGTPGWSLEDKVQILNEVVTGAWNMGETGGKYARVVRKFERWLSRCQSILDARGNEEIQDESIMFLEGLDADWKDDCQYLGRKLEGWRDHLKDLGLLESESSLATTVDGCRNLVRNMLMEISIMGQIERDAMAMESEWIRGMNDDNSDDDNRPTAGATWRIS
jgi:hypothetical protein